ncbi:SDR family NAD(P)-dependent oxidoreductase [Caballeronia sp. LjRoot34]|uniref:SDR family NAD(P)-dependent oxidoreductase n=1 Tax=Caballeronia sp. LjRoot34 TaxID=3342325 RepID=UPI003ED02C0F
MKALVLRQHGGPEALGIEPEFPEPSIGNEDVLIRVRASALNYHDIFTRRGMPGIKIPLPAIIGLDIAGEIIAVGDDVRNWSVGDRVLVDPANMDNGDLIGENLHGGMAELCRVPSHHLLRLNDSISFEKASALPVAYGTAHRMVNTIGQIRAGEKVLILGASGGVGVACVQLAKLLGAHVIACAGTAEKAKMLKALGADDVIEYREVDFADAVIKRYGKATRNRGTSTGGVDVVINFTGGETWVKSLRTLRLGGRLLTCGATAGFAPPEDIRYIWTFELQIRGSNSWDRHDLTSLLVLVERGELNPLIDHIAGLEDARDALERMEARALLGKVIITP